MSWATHSRGALRCLLAAPPPSRTSIRFRPICQTAGKIKLTRNPMLSFHDVRVSPKRNSVWQRLRFFHVSRAGKNKPSTPNPVSPSDVAVEAEPQTLGAKMRKLTREYGWSAAGVYFTLSVLDLPFCYLLLKTLGEDRVAEWERIVVSKVAPLIPDTIKQKYHEWKISDPKTEPSEISNNQDSNEKAGWGVEEAEQEYKVNASLATQIAFVLAIHKSLIFLRIPLAVAVTPRVVKLLRSWGWDIGKRTTKEVKAIKRAHRAKSKEEIQTKRKP